MPSFTAPLWGRTVSSAHASDLRRVENGWVVPCSEFQGIQVYPRLLAQLCRVLQPRLKQLAQKFRWSPVTDLGAARNMVQNDMAV